MHLLARLHEDDHCPDLAAGAMADEQLAVGKCSFVSCVLEDDRAEHAAELAEKRPGIFVDILFRATDVGSVESAKDVAADERVAAEVAYL